MSASPPALPSGLPATQRVDFYVLPGDEASERARLACRLAEKAYLAGQRMFVWLQDPAQLASFDELLWSFSDRSFVPHEPYSDARQWQDSAVLLSCQALPAQRYDVLLNLGGEAPPAAAAQAARIIELIDAEPARRQAGRERFRRYRELGLNPQTHHIAADERP